jgi:hypothetical protein
VAGLRELVEEHLRRTIAVLGAFVAAGLLGWLADVPKWSKVLSGLAFLVALVLVTSWLPDSASKWREHWRTRAAALGIPLGVALFVLGLGIRAPDQAAVEYENPATLLVVDSSAQMGESLHGGLTKLKAAIERIKTHARELAGDQLGLAAFGGGGCKTDPPANLLVRIARGQKPRIISEAEQLRARGKANLAAASRYARNMLGQFKGEERRVILVVAGLDECNRDLSDVLSEARDSDVKIKWDLVGLGLSPEEKQQADALPSVDVRFADTPQQVDEVFRFVLYERPLRQEFEALDNYVQSEVRGSLNEAIGSMNAQDPETTRKHLAMVNALVEEGDDRFGSFVAAQKKPEFEAVKNILRRQLDLLAASVPRIEAVASFDTRHKGDLSDEELSRRNDLMAEANEPIGAYNSGLSALSDAIEKMLEHLFGRQ